MYPAEGEDKNERALTGIGVVQPEQQWDQGWFSRPAGSHHSHDGTSWDQQAEVLEDRSLPTGRVGEGDVTELQPALQLVWRKHQAFCGGAEEETKII